MTLGMAASRQAPLLTGTPNAIRQIAGGDKICARAARISDEAETVAKAQHAQIQARSLRICSMRNSGNASRPITEVFPLSVLANLLGR